MRFVVTGGAGFVGNNIVRLLLSRGYSVSVIDNLHTGRKENLTDISHKIQFYEKDIRNIDEIEPILKDSDGIFHQAALTIVQESFFKEKEYFDVNVKGTENIFQIGLKYNKKIVFASSSSVYGNSKKIPITEDSEKKPINPYGITKLEDEFLAENYSKKGLEVIGLRYFNIFGKGQTGSYAGVITQFLRKLKDNQPPIIFGDGTQVRDFIHVTDIAEANLSAMLSDINTGFYNVGTGKATTIMYLAKTLIEVFGKEFNPEFRDALKGDVKISQADTKLIKAKLNWKSKIGLKEGLENFMS